MTRRQARRERREAERKAKKLELKKSRLAENNPPAASQLDCARSILQDGSGEIANPQRNALPGSCLDDDYPEIQPRWNPELEDEFPKEVQIRNNAMADRISLKAGLPIPPPGPSPGSSIEALREHLLARRKAAAKLDPSPKTNDNEPALNEAKTHNDEPAVLGEAKTYNDEPALLSEAKIKENGFVSQSTPSRPEINRANAQHSTGPRTKQGKLASSGNSFKHGLASGQLIIPGEDPSAFEAFLNDLVAEHQPSTETEHLLVNEMAQSHWLTRRAIRFQNGCFTAEGVNERQLALFLRYQTTHERSFYKAFNTLLKLKKAHHRNQSGFVSQQRPTSTVGFVSQPTGNSSQNEFVRQNSSATDLHSGFVSQEAPSGPTETRCAA